MEKLYLGIGDGNVQTFEFKTPYDLKDYLIEIENSFKNIVWLFCLENEIFISESFDTFFTFIGEYIGAENESELDLEYADITEYYLQEYQSYEDAYAVALEMREGNKLQFNK